MVREFGDAMLARARVLAANERTRAIARDLELSFAFMSETAEAQWAAQGFGPFAIESTKASPGPDRASSSSPPWNRSRSLTVATVAERLCVSEQWVRELCRTGTLSATKQGREWWIDPDSVEALLLAREVSHERTA